MSRVYFELGRIPHYLLDWRREREKQQYREEWLEEIQQRKELSNRPRWTRMARKHLSIETLKRYNLDYELDKVSNDLDYKRELKC